MKRALGERTIPRRTLEELSIPDVMANAALDLKHRRDEQTATAAEILCLSLTLDPKCRAYIEATMAGWPQVQPLTLPPTLAVALSAFAVGVFYDCTFSPSTLKGKR